MLPLPGGVICYLGPRAEANGAFEDFVATLLAFCILADGAVVGRELCHS